MHSDAKYSNILGETFQNDGLIKKTLNQKSYHILHTIPNSIYY